jgi:archaetidylinositol phosphate synthase
MVLNKYRSGADRFLIPVAKAFYGLSPNTLSAASVLFALLAGIAFVFSDATIIEDRFNPDHYIYIMFLIASVCIFLNGFLDAVDGKVARLTKKTSKRGDFLDHALDRYADVLILGGIMLSPYCDPVIGAVAIIAVLLTSYMGTQAQALGCGRNYSGLLGRADRLVILIFAPGVQMGVLYYTSTGRIPIQYIENFTILEYVMLWFFIAGNFTAIHRGIQSWRELREQELANPSQKERAKKFYQRLSEPRSGISEGATNEATGASEDVEPKIKPRSVAKKRTAKMGTKQRGKLAKGTRTRKRKMKTKSRPTTRRVRKAKKANPSKNGDNKIEWD